MPVSPQVARRLGLDPATGSLSPVDLVSAVLAAPVDLFWNGGIGTYVKASTESHAEVGDKANDALRIDGRDLRVRVVGEGGNLGLTQRGRIEAALSGGPDGAGVKLNTDAIDNSAGVDCSDHEVNIKILLDHLVAQGHVEPGDRNQTLLRMTDEVGALVLRDNYDQNVVLSVEGGFAPGLLPAHRRFLDALQRNGDVDLRLEALPSSADLDRRARDGLGMTMPELSVLSAHAKITLGAALLAGGLPDEPWVAATLSGYFPSELRERFADHLVEHPLRREIATTVLVNHLVGTGGLTFAFRAAEETGCDPADVVRAFAVAMTVFGVPERAAAVEALDGLVPAQVQSRMRQTHQRLLDRTVRWLLHARPEGIDVPVEVERFGAVVAGLVPQVPGLLRGDDADAVAADEQALVAEGVPAAEALRTAAMLATFPLLDVVEVAAARGRAPLEVAQTWFELSHRYRIEAMLDDIAALPRTDRWQSLARSALRDDLYSVLRDLTSAVLVTSAGGGAGAAVDAWEQANAPAVRRALSTLTDLQSAERADLAALSVGLRVLRTVLRSG